MCDGVFVLLFAVSDLHAMGFDPVNDARNFSSLSKPEYFKQQIEEMYASEHGTFAPDVVRAPPWGIFFCTAAGVATVPWCTCQ
jgi:hypothetical protein